MASALLTCPAMCLGQMCACCAASTCSSLCGACCGCEGIDRTGRRRSVFLLVLSLGAALGLQYGLAPRLASMNMLSMTSDYLASTLQGDCLTNEIYAGLESQCIGNIMVYRSSFCSALFFLIASAVSACTPKFNSLVWPAKYSLFFLMLLVSLFLPTQIFDENGYLWVARIGGAMFIIFQQIILIDVAYNWNDAWVANADEDDLQEYGSGKKWLIALVLSAVILFVGSFVAIGYFYHYFSGADGCSSNTAFITVTLLVTLLFTATQMSGEEGSLLTSALLMAYSVYLCYSALIKNPSETCNPFLGTNDGLGIIVGLTFTVVSLAWTGFSYTAEVKLGDGSTTEGEVQANQQASTEYGTVSEGGNEAEAEVCDESFSWKLNLVLAVLSMFYAVLLTGWGVVSDGQNAANPTIGFVSMWLIIASQWLAMLLYIWTLVAPRLFPDRDFS